MISMNSFKLNNLESFGECVCTNHCLKSKKRELREIGVGLVELEVRPSFFGSHLSCSSARWAIDVVQHVGGEILSEFAFGVFERSPSHLFLYLLLFKTRKAEVGTEKDSARFEHHGV